MKNKKTGDWQHIATTRMLTRIINILHHTKEANITKISRQFLGRSNYSPVKDALLFLVGVGIVEVNKLDSYSHGEVKYYSLTPLFRKFYKNNINEKTISTGRKNAI